MTHPLDLVNTLRTAADLQGKDSQISREELLQLARDLELWTVNHRHQLEDTSPRATPSNLRLLAGALDYATTQKKPQQVIKDTAKSLRALAQSLQEATR